MTMTWKRNTLAHWTLFLLCFSLPSPAFHGFHMHHHHHRGRINLVSAVTNTKQQHLSNSVSDSCPLLTVESTVVTRAYSSSNGDNRNVEDDDDDDDTHDVDAYHLIWSPHVVRKVLFTTPLLFATKHLLLLNNNHYFSGLGQHLFCCHSATNKIPLFQNWILPLFASSCCLLQLGLNLLSVGCAGFNTYLGPIRPYFLSLFLVITSSTIMKHQQPPLRWGGALWLLTQTTVAFLPELVHVYNTRRSQRRVIALQQQQQAEGLATSRADTGATNTPVMNLQATIQLEIPTMGCVACINTIDNALNHKTTHPRARVVQAASALHPLGMKGGSATIRVLAQDEKALIEITSQLKDATENAGFAGATVISILKEQQQSS